MGKEKKIKPCPKCCPDDPGWRHPSDQPKWGPLRKCRGCKGKGV